MKRLLLLFALAFPLFLLASEVDLDSWAKSSFEKSRDEYLDSREKINLERVRINAELKELREAVGELSSKLERLRHAREVSSGLAEKSDFMDSVAGEIRSVAMEFSNSGLEVPPEFGFDKSMSAAADCARAAIGAAEREIFNPLEMEEFRCKRGGGIHFRINYIGGNTNENRRNPKKNDGAPRSSEWFASAEFAEKLLPYVRIGRNGI